MGLEDVALHRVARPGPTPSAYTEKCIIGRHRHFPPVHSVTPAAAPPFPTNSPPSSTLPTLFTSSHFSFPGKGDTRIYRPFPHTSV